MVYSFDDFRKIKDSGGGFCNCAGMFGSDIYAVRFYREGSCGSEFWYEIFRLTKEEFDNYPLNALKLSDRFRQYDGEVLCSDYSGKGGSGYCFEYLDGVIHTL